MLLLLLAPAFAHRPHAVIVSAAMDEGGPGWALLAREGVIGMLRSDDEGAHWDYVGGEPVGDDLVELAILDRGGRILGALSEDDARLWWTGDDGETWASAALGARGRSLAPWGDGFAVGTDAGLMQVSLDGTVQPLGTGASVARVRSDGGELLAVLDGGPIYHLGLDQALPPLPDGAQPWMAVAWEGDVIAGSDKMAWALRDGAAEWERCGRLPITSTDTHAEEVPFLVNDGVRLMAASGRQSFYVSEDGCRSWVFYDSGQEARYGGLGQAETPDEAYTGLYWRGDRIVVAGFMGISTSADGGADFREVVTVPGDSVRGVDFAPDWPRDPRLWFGGYGGGGWYSDDGGNTWSGSAVGLDDEGPYGLALYSYGVAGTRDGGALYSGALIPYYSPNGASWTELDVPMVFTTNFDDQGGLWFAYGGSTGREMFQVAVSQDRGASWSLLEGLNRKLGGRFLHSLVPAVLDGVQGWMVTPADGVQLWFSADLETWTELVAHLDASARGGAAWPPETGERLVIVERAGVAWLSDMVGGQPGPWRSVEIPFGGDIQAFEMADDGTFILVDRVGQVIRSQDGGESWQPVGEPVPAPLNVLTVADNFASTGALMIGTWAGTWWSGDRGETLHQLPRYVRHEDTSVHLRCKQARAGAVDCDRYQAEAQGNAGGWLMYSGDRVRLSFKGTGITALGAVEGDRAELVIDGVPHALSGSGPHVIDGLGSGWHDADLSTSYRFHLDAVEIDGEGVPMIAPVDPASAGCASGGSGRPAGWWLLALAYCWKRSSRKRMAPKTSVSELDSLR